MDWTKDTLKEARTSTKLSRSALAEALGVIGILYKIGKRVLHISQHQSYQLWTNYLGILKSLFLKRNMTK